MKIESKLIKCKDFVIPGILLEPPVSIGAAVILHGYGGCKEEQLGLAYRVSKLGILTCVIDLHGHGENPYPLDENIVKDVENIINYLKPYGKVALIGHSLGGRLALLSNADFTIGISPALNKNFGLKTQETLRSLRSYRVKEEKPNILFNLLHSLDEYTFSESSKSQIIYGSRDVPEIILDCRELKRKGASVIEINNALHNDIFLLEETFKTVESTLYHWFNNTNTVSQKEL